MTYFHSLLEIRLIATSQQRMRQPKKIGVNQMSRYDWSTTNMFPPDVISTSQSQFQDLPDPPASDQRQQGKKGRWDGGIQVSSDVQYEKESGSQEKEGRVGVNPTWRHSFLPCSLGWSWCYDCVAWNGEEDKRQLVAVPSTVVAVVINIELLGEAVVSISHQSTYNK